MAKPRDHYTPTPPSLCYACGCKLDYATAIEGSAAPHPGDVGVCMNCGAPHVFGEGLTRRPMTERDWIALSPEDRSLLPRAMAACAKRRAEDGDLEGARAGHA